MVKGLEGKVYEEQLRSLMASYSIEALQKANKKKQNKSTKNK